MASGTEKVVISIINGIRKIENAYFTAVHSTNSVGDLVVLWNYDIQTVVPAALAARAGT